MNTQKLTQAFIQSHSKTVVTPDGKHFKFTGELPEGTTEAYPHKNCLISEKNKKSWESYVDSMEVEEATKDPAPEPIKLEDVVTGENPGATPDPSEGLQINFPQDLDSMSNKDLIIFAKEKLGKTIGKNTKKDEILKLIRG